jgi:hypothetical protein
METAFNFWPGGFPIQGPYHHLKNTGALALVLDLPASARP